MNEAKSEQAAFRIGGVYRDRGGRTIRLHEEAASCGGPCGYAERLLDSGRWVPFGANFLSTGRDRNDEGDDYCLIPGELTLRDGQWVPVEEAEEDNSEGDGLGSTKAPLDQLRDLVEVQGRDGTWNYDGYMCGMFNGMELALAILEGREPQYRTLRKRNDAPAPRGLTLSPDLRATSHLVEPVHGSVALTKRA